MTLVRLAHNVQAITRDFYADTGAVMKRQLFAFWTTTLLTISAFTFAAADTTVDQSGAIAGKTVYDTTCAGCHRSNPAAFKTPPNEVTEVLKSGKIRYHHFNLTDSEIKALVDYLTTLSK